MTTPQTIARAALAAALIALAAVLMWVAVIQATTGRSAALPSFVLGLVPLVAAWLLFKRPVIGSTLAAVAAVLGAGLAFVLNFCLCPTPLPTEFVALYIVALVVLVLAVLELVLLGYAWLAIVLLLAGLALTGNPIFIGLGVVVAGLVIWLLLRRRRSASPPPPAGGT